MPRREFHEPHQSLFEPIRDNYPPLLTTAQVAELLHLGSRTVLSMAADGRLRASRIPGTRQYNFFRDDVIRVLAEHLVPSTTAADPLHATTSIKGSRDGSA